MDSDFTGLKLLVISLNMFVQASYCTDLAVDWPGGGKK